MAIKLTFSENLSKADAIVELTSTKEAVVVIKEAGQKVMSLGISDRKQVGVRKLFLIARQIIALAKQHKLKKLGLTFSDFQFDHLGLSPRELGELMAVNFEMANYEFNTFKTLPDEQWSPVEEIVIRTADKDAQQGFAKGQVIANEVNATRTLSNTPGGEMTPKLLVAEIRKAAKGTKTKLTVLGRAQMQKLGMGGVLGVAQGSSEEPQFIILEYKGGAKNEKPVVLVGKGVTFDTGGLNLKPSKHIYEMHMDMSGGAAVLHAVIAAAKLGLKKNVVALVPAVENMPSGSSYRPGDLLRTLSGMTIEVMDTDAEGRVILSDALFYAKRYDPKVVIDVATLTGAAEVALGARASAIFSRDAVLSRKFMEMGEASGDYVWPLPLWDEYEEDIKGTFGDWANVGKKERSGGAITAAMFLYQFIKPTPWLHIDMAPRMTAVEGEHLAKGAAGAPVRLLIKALETL